MLFFWQYWSKIEGLAFSYLNRDNWNRYLSGTTCTQEQSEQAWGGSLTAGVCRSVSTVDSEEGGPTAGVAASGFRAQQADLLRRWRAETEDVRIARLTAWAAAARLQGVRIDGPRGLLHLDRLLPRQRIAQWRTHCLGSHGTVGAERMRIRWNVELRPQMQWKY